MVVKLCSFRRNPTNSIASFQKSLKFFIVAHDISDAKAHLMPWRTVCEITKGLRDLGHEAMLVSLDKFQGPLLGDQLPSDSRAIRKQRSKLAEDLKCLEQIHRPDIIFWPMSWRDPRFRIRALSLTSATIVGWFPGGDYSKPSTIYALRRLGIRGALPYLREAWAPRKRQVKRWKEYNIQNQLAMTNYTANSIVVGGYNPNSVFSIPPGREDIENESEIEPIEKEVRTWLGGRKYFLFMGPPSAIRGIFELLSAFEIAAKKDSSICLVCLFRSDGKLDRDSISRTISSMSVCDRIYARWESVSRLELNSFIKSGYVTVMPFVIVPSEIPLAIIETARWGKPVVTTSPGGTGEYVEQFGSTPRVGDIDALAQAILRLSNDRVFYEQRSKAAVRTYKAHPTWKQVSAQWLEVAEKAVEAAQ